MILHRRVTRIVMRVFRNRYSVGEVPADPFWVRIKL